MSVLSRFFSWLRAALSGRSSRLVVAVVGSLLAHLLILFGHQIELSMPSDLVPLEARLVRSAPSAKPGQAAKNDAPPKPSVPKPKPKEAPQAPQAEGRDPPLQTPPPEAQPEPEKIAEAQPESLPVPEVPTEVGQLWPRSGVIRYLLFGGEGRDPAANSTAELSWQIDDDGRYRLKLESRDAKPFPSIPAFTITLLYLSQGKMVDGMFRPDRYEEAISVFRNIVVSFDWENMQADFAGHRLPLQVGSLDYLSVIMQSGDPGFVEKGQFSVATGRGLRQYQFDATGEENLALPFGMTWKTRQLFGKTGNNDIRIWVATEKFNLPVQIKFVVNKVNYYLIATEVLIAKTFVTKPPRAGSASPNGPAVPAGETVVSKIPPTERQN